MRKKAYKIVKAVFQSSREDFNVKINFLTSDEWNVDKNTNFLHIPFRIDTFPACGMFENYFKDKFGDRRAVVEYDKDDVFILKLDWERLLLPEAGISSFVRDYRSHMLAVFFVLLMAWYYFIWTTTRSVPTTIKE